MLHKQAVIRNTGTSVWNRLLDVRLGSYATDATPFRDYLGPRMRRVLRGHDRPYAILATCGAQAGTDETYDFTAISEATSLDHISHMAEGQRTAGLHWDYYDIEFWHDPAGDLKVPDAKRFPNGFDPVLSELKKLGTMPGLWISSGCTDSNLFKGAIDRWTIGSNPALQACGTDGDGRGRLCRATEPANRMHIVPAAWRASSADRAGPPLPEFP